MKRLGDEIERAAAHAFDRKLDRCKRGQENDRQRGVRLARGGQHLEPLAIAHLLVGDNGVERRPRRARARACGEARGLDHLVAFLAQVRGKDPPHARLVIYDQYSGHREAPKSAAESATLAGIAIEKHTWPGSLTPEHEVAAMRAGDVARDRETQSRAAGLGREERLEKVRDGVGRDRTCVVAHFEADRARFRRPPSA